MGGWEGLCVHYVIIEKLLNISSSPVQLQGWFGERLVACLAQICTLITFDNISLGAIPFYLMVLDSIPSAWLRFAGPCGSVVTGPLSNAKN